MTSGCPSRSQTPRPILVTGSHRSGTTWVGRMIATSPRVGYILEPFHLNHRPGICRAQFKYWFTYVCEENEAEYKGPLADCLAFKYQFGRELRSLRHPHHLLALLKDLPNFRRYRREQRRPLMKDPIAFFSAEWLARTFDMQVVTLIRHPAAFAGSLKEVGWTFSFDHFLAQPHLMASCLRPYRSRIEALSEGQPDIIEQAILLWNIIHSVIMSYQERHSDWLFLRHQDLASEPVAGFQTVFKHLDLDYSEEIKRQIRRSSDQSNPVKQRSINDTVRDSRAVIHNWHQRLTEGEVERIRKGCADVWPHFYGEDDWS